MRLCPKIRKCFYFKYFEKLNQQYKLVPGRGYGPRPLALAGSRGPTSSWTLEEMGWKDPGFFLVSGARQRLAWRAEQAAGI